MSKAGSFRDEYLANLAAALTVPAEALHESREPTLPEAESYLRTIMLYEEYHRVVIQQRIMARLMVSITSPRADRIHALLSSRSGRRRRRGERLMQAEMRRPIASFDLDRPAWVDPGKERL